jgi:hypothetical protein
VITRRGFIERLAAAVAVVKAAPAPQSAPVTQIALRGAAFDRKLTHISVSYMPLRFVRFAAGGDIDAGDAVSCDRNGRAVRAGSSATIYGYAIAPASAGGTVDVRMNPY